MAPSGPDPTAIPEFPENREITGNFSELPDFGLSPIEDLLYITIKL
jgi:hypothetical protein